MIHVTFPDGSLREYAPGTTGAEIAAQISKSLSKKAVAMTLDGVLSDLNDPIVTDARLEIVTRDDPRALELIRHDAAHVMAEAVQELFPGTQVTIGPAPVSGTTGRDFLSPFRSSSVPIRDTSSGVLDSIVPDWDALAERRARGVGRSRAGSLGLVMGSMLPRSVERMVIVYGPAVLIHVTAEALELRALDRFIVTLLADGL